MHTRTTLPRTLINQCVVFFLTYIAYALLHANRKAFGNLKPAIVQTWTVSIQNASQPILRPSSRWSRPALFDNEEDAAVFLGILDSLFMAAYAIGLYVSGWLGDRMDRRLVLCVGLSGSAVLIFFFGVLFEWIHFYNKYLYSFIWIFNGLCQAAVWPSAVAVMNVWFSRYRGLVIGIWSSCASVGNIIGDLVIGATVPFGYDYGFLVLSTIMFGFSLMVCFGLLDSNETNVPVHYMGIEQINDVAIGDLDDDYRVPLLIPVTLSASDTSQSGCDGDDDDDGDGIINRRTSNSTTTSKRLSFLRILMVPDVISCSLAYACIKLVNYALFFWLTFYLTKNFHWSNSEASTFSVWYDVGGIAGGVLAGLLFDFMTHHSSGYIVNLAFSMAALPALFGYSYTPAEPQWLNAVVMSLVGFFVGGPAVLVSAVVVGSISERPELKGGRTQATIAGIIDGTGSVGAAAGQVLIPYLAYQYGWSIVFYFFIVCMGLTSLCLIPGWLSNCRTHRAANTAAGLLSTPTETVTP